MTLPMVTVAPIHLGPVTVQPFGIALLAALAVGATTAALLGRRRGIAGTAPRTGWTEYVPYSVDTVVRVHDLGFEELLAAAPGAIGPAFTQSKSGGNAITVVMAFKP